MTLQVIPSSGSLESDAESEDIIEDCRTFRVIRRSSGSGTAWTAFEEQRGWFEFARQVVASLVQERESLAFQLSHAHGLVSEEDFDATIGSYLWEPQPRSDLHRKTVMLAELIPELVDAEIVSTVFRCPVVDAERALKVAATQVRFFFADPVDSVRLTLTERNRAGTR